ncbi:MerR family transcriptional regulator [Ruania albidiflava]|uniref:MerR family transcriptional regulator n=1 Tax=Ruania albidiflava TaxID=366586 RepID=UPI0003B64FFE|nr:MerR family transcriptional regulator [Ruania albidiflava]
MTEHLTIGAFARRTGLSLKALRRYDESGLLVPDAVDERTGYRYYSPAQVNRARQISLLRRVEMPLAQIADLLATSDPVAASETLLGWWAEQERLLTHRRGTVDYLLDQWRRAPEEPFQVEVRSAPERTLATITSRVLQADLVATLVENVHRLREHLTASEAVVTEEWWAIYHGVVSPDSDGPLEVCVPFEGLVPPVGRIAIRIEEGRTEAYAPISAAQCSYPRILHAYDAVTDWVRRHGEPTGPPREVYRVPWPEDPTAYVADIALPYREAPW